jgi:hypothetical protein
MYRPYLYPIITLLLVSSTTASAQSSTTTTTTTTTTLPIMAIEEGATLVSNAATEDENADADGDSLASTSTVIDETIPPPTAPQQLLLPQTMKQHNHNPQQNHNRRRRLTSDERHELQRQAMSDAVLHHQEQKQKHVVGDDQEELPPIHSSFFSSVQEMRSFYYFHSGVINAASRNAIRMASSASVYAAGTTTVDTKTNVDNENDFKSTDDRMEEVEGGDDDTDEKVYDDDYGNDEDYLLNQFAQNAIENKLMQVQRELEELMLIQQALVNNELRAKDDEDILLYDGIHQDDDNDSCQSGNQSLELSSIMSMNVDNNNQNSIPTESDINSCSNYHPTNEKKKAVQHQKQYILPASATFTNEEYINIQHRLNCRSSQYRHRNRMVDSMSLPDAVGKWRKMRRAFWEMFDIPINEDDNGTEDYHYRYIPNPDLHVDFLPSSSSSSSPSSDSFLNTTKRGVFAARGFEKGEVVYTQKNNILYFQELSAWETYLLSLRESASASASSITNNTSNQQNEDEDVDDACLAIEWSFMKRISRPGRWLVMLVLDEGVYMRRNVPVAPMTSGILSTNGNEEYANDDIDDEDDIEDDDDDDDDDRWLEGNVALDDERSLDFVALRNIQMGEEIIIGAGIEVDE